MSTSHINVVPAYGRDYTSQKTVRADREAGKDFLINDILSRWGGKPINKEDAVKANIRLIRIRYD